MQSCVSIAVSQIKISNKAQEVYHRNLSLLVGCPVERSATTMISLVNIKTLLFKIVDWDGLVALNCRMQHVEADVVLSVYVSAILEKLFAHVNVATEWGKVERCEIIFFVFKVYPFFNMFRRQRLFSDLNKRIKALWFVMICRLM